jgi:hypothetical protein
MRGEMLPHATHHALDGQDQQREDDRSNDDAEKTRLEHEGERQVQGPEAGLSVLQGLEPPSWLGGSYLWDAVVSDLHRRAGHIEIARQHRARAIAAAPTEAVRHLLHRRLGIPTELC